MAADREPGRDSERPALPTPEEVARKIRRVFEVCDAEFEWCEACQATSAAIIAADRAARDAAHAADRAGACEECAAVKARLREILRLKRKHPTFDVASALPELIGGSDDS